MSSETTHRRAYCFVTGQDDLPFSLIFDTQPNLDGEPPYVCDAEGLFPFIIKHSYSLSSSGVIPNHITVWKVFSTFLVFFLEARQLTQIIKVNEDITIAVDTPAALEKHLAGYPDFALVAKRLDLLTEKTSDIFRLAIPDERLHLIIVPRDTGHKRGNSYPSLRQSIPVSFFVAISRTKFKRLGHICLRPRVVEGLYSKLEAHKLVQVCSRTGP